MNKINWYCIQSNPRKETEAAKALACLKFQTGLDAPLEPVQICLPKVRALVETKYRKYEETQAFFPSYLFARFLYSPDLFHRIRNTQNVHGLIRQSGCEPTIVDDEIVEGLLSLMDSEGFITAPNKEPLRVYSDLKLNEYVKIEDGPFQGLIAKLTSISKGKDRVMVLLSFLGREKEVQLARPQVTKYTWTELV
jgi:transcription antitermination factor NusG